MGNPTLQSLPEKDTWQTPSWLTDGIGAAIGGFDLDPCAGPDTRIAETNYSIQRGENGLQQDWFGDVWVNPPFTSKVDWVHKAISEYDDPDGADRVFLLTPDSTDVKSWFHGDIVPTAEYVWFAEGRVKFLDPQTGEPAGSPSFGAAISVFGEIEPELRNWFHANGWLARTASRRITQTYTVTD
jgi:phage N-6-adenine-methyltransferase